jgi:tetratricopeptide (TPR) repeat protein
MMTDRMVRSRVYGSMTRRIGAVLLCVAAACGGGDKKGTTTPAPAKGSGDDTQSMKDIGDPTAGGGGGSATGSGTVAVGGGSGSGSGTQPVPVDPPAAPIPLPDFDPDPTQAKAQVDQHLNVARSALSMATPDADTALREARQALAIDAANLDAAAMVAFAYYHKHLLDTAELVLDDVFKRDAAKKNANVNYVYGLIYDHTNRPEQALKAFQAAVDINPNFASALVNVGVHQIQNQQYTAAVDTFEKLTGQFNRNDVITLTSLGSAYRGHSADFPSGSPDHDKLVKSAEGAYKKATQANANYGPAYYNLGLLYLDNAPYPGITDEVQRLNTAKGFFDNYKNATGLDAAGSKLYDDRMKDVTRSLKRAQKKQAKGGTK